MAPGLHLVIVSRSCTYSPSAAMAELGSAFTQEGGPYEWAKMAFGRFQGAIAAVLYWVTNPLWVGGSLAFIATEGVERQHLQDPRRRSRRLPVQVPLHLDLDRRRHRLPQARQVDPNLGALMRVVLLGLFTLTTIIYAIKHGAAGFAVKDLKPTGIVFFALVPLLLFNYVGFELQNGAAEEMDNPQRDVPVAIVRSGITGVLLYAIPIFAILIVLPAEKVTGIGGFLDAVKGDLQRLRRRVELPARPHDDLLRRHPADLGARCG